MKPEAIIKTMLQNDQFSKWLGLEVLDCGLGYCKAKLTVKEEMLNGMQITHGGICFSLADSVFAFASNTHGKKAVSIETSISHLRPTQKGDLLIAEAKELHLGKSTAIYEVTISNQEDKKVALFKGTVFRTAENWQ